ncbi:hypothetical protein LTR49_023532 [Elasticomyces elasticus]|nr:hypothetical protein LTR49_023532 [Elasticomyces elasticus]
MADCGPSNPLAQFKQQTNVDRSLQSDRLTSRSSPVQGFRTQDPNAGVLDPEFEAFQAGVPTGDLQQYGGQFPQAQQSPYLFTGAANTSWGRAPDLVARDDVGWANDFQQLQISGSQLQHQQQFPVLHDDNLTTNWAQGFRQHVQQQPVQRPLNGGSPSPLQFQQRASMGMGMGMSGYQPQFQNHFGGQASNLAPNVQQQGKGKQPVYEAFDDAAFEAAFSQARSEMMEESAAVEAPQAQGRTSDDLMQSANNEDLLQKFNAALRKEFAQDPTVTPVNAFQKQLEKQKASGMASRDKDVERTVEQYSPTLVQTMRNEMQNSGAQKAVSQEDSQAQALAESERLKWETYAKGPDGAWSQTSEDEQMKVMMPDANDSLAAMYEKAQQRRDLIQQAEQEEVIKAKEQEARRVGIDYDAEQGTNGWDKFEPRQRELAAEEEAMNQEVQSRAEADALAATAEELLSKVQDNQSDKFRNSQFLSLMRKLRDREVKVQGDKMVDSATVSNKLLKPAAVLHEDSGYGSSGATTPHREERRGDDGHFDTHICQHPGCDIDHVYDHWESPVRQNALPMFDNSEQRPSPLVGHTSAGLVDTRPLDYGISNNDDSDIGRIDPRDGQGVRDLLDVGNLGGGTVMADEIGTSPSSPSDAGVFENVGQEGPFYGDLRTLHGARSSEGVSVSEMLYGHDGTLSRPVQWAEREDVVAGPLTQEETVERVKDTVDAMMFAGARRRND